MKKFTKSLLTLAVCGAVGFGFNFDRVEAAENTSENFNVVSAVNQNTSEVPFGIGIRVVVEPPAPAVGRKGGSVPPPIPVPPPVVNRGSSERYGPPGPPPPSTPPTPNYGPPSPKYGPPPPSIPSPRW